MSELVRGSAVAGILPELGHSRLAELDTLGPLLDALLLLFDADNGFLALAEPDQVRWLRLARSGDCPDTDRDELIRLLVQTASTPLRTWEADTPEPIRQLAANAFMVRREASQVAGTFLLVLNDCDQVATREAARLGGLDQLWNALEQIILRERLGIWLEGALPWSQGRSAILEAVTTATGLSVLAIDANGDVLAMNNALAKTIGDNVVNLLGRPLFTLLPDEGNHGQEQRIRRQLTSDDPWLHFLELQARDGNLLEYSCTTRLFRDRGQPQLLIIACCRAEDTCVTPPVTGKLHELLTSGRDAVLITDGEDLHFPGPRILYANPAFSRMTGFPPESVLGRSPHMVQGENTDRENMARFIQRLRKHRQARTEAINYTREGAEYRVEIEARESVDPLSNRRQYVATQRDVTVRRLTERSHTELELALQHVGDGVILCDHLDRISWFNGSGQTFLLSRADGMGRLLSEQLAEPGDRLPLQAALQRARTEQTAQELELVGMREGRLLWARLTPLPPRRCEPHAVAVTIRDITDFSTARHQLELQAMAMETTPSAMALTDNQGYIIWLNQTMERLFGSHIQHTGDYLPGLMPHSATAARHTLQSAIAERSDWHGEVSWYLPDNGGTALYEHALTPLRPARSRAETVYLFTGQNITARRDYTRLLELRNRRLISLVALQDLARTDARSSELALEATERIRANMMGHRASLVLLQPDGRLETMASAALGELSGSELPAPEEQLVELIRQPQDRKAFAVCLVGGDPEGGDLPSCLVVAPIGIRGRAYGALLLSTEPERQFVDADLMYHRAVADIVDSALHAETQRGRTEHLIHNDPLTNLPNRRSFLDQLQFMVEVAAEQQAELALLVLDLNRFRQINDSFGHEVGDELLRMVGTRLRQSIPDSAVVARVGADEFGVLLPFSRADAADTLAARIHEYINAPITIGLDTLHLRVSIGIATFPSDGRQADDLLLSANSARLEAKRLRQPTIASRRRGPGFTREDVRIEHRLHAALDTGSLYLHYQPIRRLDTDEVTDLEVLVRWDDPVLGQVPPARFIPVAENTGVIQALDRHVLDQALQETAASGVNVSVNVSAQTLLDEDYCGFVRRVLQKHRRPARALTLEITERVFADTARIRPVLQKLVELGVHIAIDDFGTGYSSLHLLPELPVSRLKIDRSFLGRRNEKPGYAAVILASVRLARGIGIHSLIEGVETQLDLDWVRATGLDYAQGYFLGRPAPLDDLYGVKAKPR